MIWRYFLAWFPLIIIAILNGSLREFGYKAYVGNLPAHWISSFLMILLIFLYVLAIGKKWKITSARQSFLIGTMWLIMTIIFEFGFGHFIMGNPWSDLLHDYNFLEGRIWVLVLLTMFLSPYLSHKTKIMKP